jgi:hypothetical protein
MKTIFLILLIILSVTLISSEGGAQGELIPFEKGEKWGYRNGEGKVIIQPQFIAANEFSSGGIAAVVDEKGWVYIDQRGNTVIRPFIFDNGPDYSEEGPARFTMDSKFGFFDETGRIVIKPEFDFALPFHEGLAPVCIGCKPMPEGEHYSMEGGKWGYINREGERVIPPGFDSVKRFENGKGQVKLNGQWVFIDNKGKVVSY